MQDKIPGFGAVLLMGHDGARWEDTKRQLRALFARYVIPQFEDYNELRRRSYERVTANQAVLTDLRVEAAQAAFGLRADSAPRPAPGTEASFG